jgi:hypothetical protein
MPAHRTLIGALCAAVFLLTGCFAVDLSAQVSADDTVSGTAQFGVSKALAEATGGKDALLRQLRSQRPCAFGSDYGGSDYGGSDYDDGRFVGVRCSFKGVSLARFNAAFGAAPGGGPTLSRVGSQFVLSGRFDLKQVLSSAPLPGASPSGRSVPSPGLTPDPSDSDGPTALPTGLPGNLASLLPPDLASLVPSPLPSDLSSLLPSGSLPSDADGLSPTALLSGASVHYVFSFGGRIRYSAGRISGTTVSFSPDAAGRIDFQTVADATGAVPAHPSAVASWEQRLDSYRWQAMTLAAIAALAVAVLLRRRVVRRRIARRERARRRPDRQR